MGHGSYFSIMLKVIFYFRIIRIKIGFTLLWLLSYRVAQNSDSCESGTWSLYFKGKI